MANIRDYLVTQELAIQAGGGGASGGTGGGPAPERMIPAPGAKLVAEGKKIDEMDVDKIHSEYLQACDAGYKSKVEAVHPPGCENAVHGLKKKFGDSATTYKVAWWMKNQGRCG